CPFGSEVRIRDYRKWCAYFGTGTLAFSVSWPGLGDSALMQNLQSALGVIALIAFAWAISENRPAVSPRRVATGLAITLVLAVLFLKVPPITAALGSANHVIDAIAEASRAGTAFVFGYIGGGPLP